MLGHSWGTLPALELALHETAAVSQTHIVVRLLFSKRALGCADFSVPAIPIIGDVMRYTVSAVLARLLIKRTAKAMFAPQPVPPDFLQRVGAR